MSWKYCDVEKLNSPENASLFDYPDDEIVVEEKVDGGNGCLFVEKGVLHVCSRNNDLTGGDEKTFRRSREWIQQNVKPESLNESLYYYFEHMQTHTIFYGDGVPPIIGLDIRVKEGAFDRNALFLERDAKEKEFARVGIPCVALVWRGKVKEFQSIDYAPLLAKSVYYTGQPEGIVIKNYGRLNVWGRQLFGKIVNDEFKEVNKATFGVAKKDRGDTLKLVEYAVTSARINKRIDELVNVGGQEVSRKLMNQLPVAVLTDVFKEETQWILKNCKEIDVSTLKQLVSKKCLQAIDDVIIGKGVL